MKKGNILSEITIGVLLVIVCIVITAKISLLESTDKRIEAYTNKVNIKDDNLNETDNVILNILIDTAFTSNFQSTALREKYYEYLKGYLGSAKMHIGTETLYQLEDKMKDIDAIMNLEKESDIKKMSLDSREIVLNMTEQIYKDCGLKLVHNLYGGIQKVSDIKGNYFYFGESLFEQENFDFTIFLFVLDIFLFLFNICLYIAIKNQLFIKEEIYELN